MCLKKIRDMCMKECRIIKVLSYFYLIPFTIIILFNALNSLLRTTYFDLHQEIEIAKYKWDHPLVVLAVSVGILGVLYFLLHSNRLNAQRLQGIVLVWAGAVSLSCVLLFRCIAKCDSGFLSEIAVQFLQNNFQAFEAGEYLYMYPFQLGFTAVMELIYRIFGIENYIVFELINIVCVVDIVWVMGRITEELFEDERVQKLELLLSMGMLPLFLLATFIYGDIPGWCMAIHTIYYVIRYLKEDKWTDLLKASLWLSAGIIMKSNLNIMLVAAVIAILLHALEKRNARLLLGAVGLIVISQLGMLAVNGIYSLRIGEELPEGIPKIAWVAMGMQEPYEDGAAAGWYNGYNWSVYVNNGYDHELTEEVCLEDIRQSLGRWMQEPGPAVSFIYEKFTSQWNDPTFMSLLTNEWYSRNVEPQSAVAEFFLYGLGRTLLVFVMNIYHFLIFLGVGIFSVRSLKKWSLPLAYLVLNIFGGMLFHMLWEAKSRYVLIYFVLMLPLAAWGYGEIKVRQREE